MVSRGTFLRGVAAAPFTNALPAGDTNPFPNPFFAMDTAIVTTLETLLQYSDIENLAALKYKGTAPLLSDLASWRHLTGKVMPWLERKGLKLYAAYSWARVGRKGFEIDPGVGQYGPALKGHQTIIWLPVSSTEFGPSDPDGDKMAVQAVRQAADDAAKAGCAVSLYPHFGSLVQSVADAVRVAEKAGRPNVGVTFNLCHWLRIEKPESLSGVLKLALPRLSLVTVNGADREGKEWNQLVQPLDRGTFDLKMLLRELKSLNYRGPVGLQGYGVAQAFHMEPLENLKRSMVAWRRLTASV